MRWFELEPGDRVNFKCPRLGRHMTRTVLSVHEGWVKIWHGGIEKIVFENEITSFVKGK